MLRQVEPELLDALPANDPGAIESRRDLQRLNFWMGHAGIVARELKRAFPDKPPRRVLDLGGGDGRFLLSVCVRLGPRWQGIEAIVLDRHDVLSAETRAGFAAAAWQVRTFEHDVLDYLTRRAVPDCDVVLANLV